MSRGGRHRELPVSVWRLAEGLGGESAGRPPRPGSAMATMRSPVAAAMAARAAGLGSRGRGVALPQRRDLDAVVASMFAGLGQDQVGGKWQGAVLSLGALAGEPGEAW